MEEGSHMDRWELLALQRKHLLWVAATWGAAAFRQAFNRPALFRDEDWDKKRR
jgi:hypothetical protein